MIKFISRNPPNRWWTKNYHSSQWPHGLARAPPLPPPQSFIFLGVVVEWPAPPFQCLGVRHIHLLGLLLPLNISRHLLAIWLAFNCSMKSSTSSFTCSLQKQRKKPSNQSQNMHHSVAKLQNKKIFPNLASLEHVGLTPILVWILLLFGRRRWMGWLRSCSWPSSSHRCRGTLRRWRRGGHSFLLLCQCSHVLRRLGRWPTVPLTGRLGQGR